jgi:ABC-type uncharacterized transport system permease subunit
MLLVAWLPRWLAGWLVAFLVLQTHLCRDNIHVASNICAALTSVARYICGALPPVAHLPDQVSTIVDFASAITSAAIPNATLMFSSSTSSSYMLELNAFNNLSPKIIKYSNTTIITQLHDTNPK